MLNSFFIEITAKLSFNIANLSPSDVALRAPTAHRTIGTFSKGTVQFGLSFFNMEEEIKAAIEAVSRISKQ